MRQLLTTVDALQARGIGLRSLHGAIDATSATGRLILRIFAALGRFEVELLLDRTRLALSASRARGRLGGRPPEVGCSPSTLYRHVPGGRTAVAESGMPTSI
jgi:DNA invertase Pin-like site-specific DNA recombinase